MKKFICLALSVLHLMGITGGYWLFFGVQQLHYKVLAQRLDMDSYVGSQAITIKLPVDETDGSNMDNYERVDYTAESYADALNTETPSKNGSVGKGHAYGLFDINASWKINNHVMLRVNVNNVSDKLYFTKRPQFYPGPGVWSSDGRSFVVTLGFSI